MAKPRSKKYAVTLHCIADDGLPDMDKIGGNVAFIFDGCVVSGWPLDESDGDVRLWEGNSDVCHGRKFYGVTHWLEFAVAPLDMT